MVNRKYLLHVCVAAALAAGSQVQALEVVLDPTVKYQTIDGWGTCNTPDVTTTLGLQEAKDYAALGMNMVRVYASKNVLVKSSSDFLTPVPLLTPAANATPAVVAADLAANVAKMNFSAGGMDKAGKFAKWLTTNALEPTSVKINTDSWSPPAWMKGPDEFTSDWVGNHATTLYNSNTVSNPFYQVKYPTPWLSGQHNGNINLGANSTNNGDSIGGRLLTDTANLQQYGDYMAAWVAAFQKTYGVSVYSMNIQNEATFENDFDSMTMIKDADGTIDYNQYAICLDAVKNAWTTFGMTTKVLGPGTARVGDSPSQPSLLNDTMNMIQAVNTFSADPSLKNFLGIYGTNYYLSPTENSAVMLAAYWNGKQNVAGANFQSWLLAPGISNSGKPVWFTENGDGGSEWLQNPTASTNQAGNGAITVALNIYNALVYSNASAYEYWAFADGSTTATSATLIGTNEIANPLLDKKYDAFKQMSRYILPGAQRISATFKSTGTPISSTDQYASLTSVDVTSFIDTPDKMITVVLLNMENATNPVTIDIPANLLNGSMQVYCTDGNADNFNEVASNLTAVKNPVTGLFQVTVDMQPFSIYTLVGAITVPVPEPTSCAFLGLGAFALLRRRR